MNNKKFVLSYYQNATDDFHVTRITEPREALELHSHDYFQMYYVLGGRLLHHVENSTAELVAGDVFILPPNVPHYIEKREEKVDFYVLSFMPDYFQSIKESNKLLLDFLYYLKSEKLENIQPKITLAYDDLVFAEVLFKRILEEFLGKKTGGGEIVKESVSVLLSLFARVYFEETADALIAEENKQLVMHCVEYIKHHYDEEITLAEMVRRSAMSRSCFCEQFSAIVGTTFKEYLKRYRIERAVEQISAGIKISAVATCCGYGDFSTFYRNFKKYTGISPSEFANKNAVVKSERMR